MAFEGEGGALVGDGEKIQAFIRKPMMKKFKDLVTNLTQCDAMNVPQLGVVPCNSQILETGGHSDYLIDFIGVLVAVSDEKRSVRDGRTTRVVQMELIDDKRKAYCAIFGNYVDLVKDFLRDTGSVVVMQNVLNTKRILWNPIIPQVVDFKERASPVEEFLHMFPKKTISELHETEEWWYSACKCNKVVTVDGDNYYCAFCASNATKVSPRYKLKVQVFDGEDRAAFVMFDSDAELMTGISCASLLAHNKDGVMDHLTHELEDLGGKDFLFKVEKVCDFAFEYDDTFKVKRFCVEEEIIEHFKKLKKPSTPKVDNTFDPAPYEDVDTKEGSFCVAEYLSDQAGCPIGTGGGDVNEASCNGVRKERGKGKMVNA
ncbi:hypothetical protein SESBI_44122 [Sesbania bispinosa]|nr:hypothetical protein SESBI_44122 [Sesbania bispinosa]